MFELFLISYVWKRKKSRREREREGEGEGGFSGPGFVVLVLYLLCSHEIAPALKANTWNL